MDLQNIGQGAALFERTEILVGASGTKLLRSKRVFVAGVGGVGGHLVEALVRAGIGAITICDHDVVSSSNKNRQLIALDCFVGKSKVMMLADRVMQINSNCDLIAMDAFLLPEDMNDILTRHKYDYVVDCIDSVECKIALLITAVKLKIPVFSSCGAGGKMNPMMVRCGDLFDTSNDALARLCRSALRKEGIDRGAVRVVYSDELGKPPLPPSKQESGGRDRAINGTISYLPPMFGLVLSAMVIQFALSGDKKHLEMPKPSTSGAWKQKQDARGKQSAQKKSATSTKPPPKRPRDDQVDTVETPADAEA